MKTQTHRRFFAATCLLILAVLVAALPSPVYGVSKEMLRVMQQLDDMQQQLTSLQKTVDTQTAVLRTLIEQTNDKVVAMQTEMDDLKKTTQQDLQKGMASNGARFDTMTSQIEALGASLDDTKARLAKLNDQMAQLQNMIQTLNTPQTPANPATGQGGQPQPGPQAPDPDALFRSGTTNFQSGQYDLAIQAFQQYLDNYGTTDRALDAQFYIGEAYYAQGKYAQAVDAYNLCLEKYPAGAKLPAAQLKKGYALLALKQNAKAVRELKSLIQRFPSSHEAELARQRLRKLSASR